MNLEQYYVSCEPSVGLQGLGVVNRTAVRISGMVRTAPDFNMIVLHALKIKITDLLKIRTYHPSFIHSLLLIGHAVQWLSHAKVVQQSANTKSAAPSL